MIKQERAHLLEQQIQRLKKRIDILSLRSNRYSWARVAIFFSGLALSTVVFFVNWWLCLILILITLVAFGIVAHYHGKLESSITRHTLWLHIKTTHLARLQLDWNSIPAAYSSSPQAEHPFEFDLDITGEHSIHQLLNTAVSHEGSQRLHDWLLNTTPDLTTIHRRQTLVRELTPLTLFRDKLTMKSLLASKRVSEHLEGKRLLHWLSQQTQHSLLPVLLWGSVALNILTIVLLALNTFAGVAQYWVFSLLLSLLLFFTTSEIRGDTFEDATYLRYTFATLSAVFAYLETFPYGKQQNLKKLCEPFYQDREHRPSQLLKGTARIAAASTLEKNRLIWVIVNAFIPWDLYCAYRLSRYKVQIAVRLPLWLDTWFELEALCSLAAFSYLNPEYVLPDIVSAEDNSVIFRAADLGHPLIPAEKKATNDFTMNELGEVVIITGSNMAGKSTFLRTLGVNLCLAYAGGPVNASMLQTSLLRIFTCIRVSDSVTDGYSYFYAEVRRLKALLLELEQNHRFPLFFLIDEIFKGTNNRERLSGSRAYVRALAGRNCLGLISTHDLELVKLAEVLPSVRNYHFREEVLDGHMIFDYVLRSGPCPTTNALRIMQLEGLPVEDII